MCESLGMCLNFLYLHKVEFLLQSLQRFGDNRFAKRGIRAGVLRNCFKLVGRLAADMILRRNYDSKSADNQDSMKCGQND